LLILLFGACGAREPAQPPAVQAEIVDGVQFVRIAVTDTGYEPDRVQVAAGSPVRLVFDQQSESPCGAKVKSEELGIALTKLPFGEQTVIEINPDRSGEFKFTCGMNMMEGTVLISESVS